MPRKPKPKIVDLAGSTGDWTASSSGPPSGVSSRPTPTLDPTEVGAAGARLPLSGKTVHIAEQENVDRSPCPPLTLLPRHQPIDDAVRSPVCRLLLDSGVFPRWSRLLLH